MWSQVDSGLNERCDVVQATPWGRRELFGKLMSARISAHAGSTHAAVAASDADDTLTQFSNWGKSSVHLAAPGAMILNTW